MVNHRDKVSLVFAALADPTRRQMLEDLARGGERRVVDLSKPFPISPPAVTKHLRALEKARLIRRRRSGREHYIRAISGEMNRARTWMEACADGWKFSFSKLDQLIGSGKTREGRS